MKVQQMIQLNMYQLLVIGHSLTYTRLSFVRNNIINIMTIRKQAFINLDIPAENKTILCLDGGGIRGILTVQLLKKLEQISGKPCFELFDMVSGTSTGGIIAGLIALGKTAEEIEVLYIRLVKKVFINNSVFSNRFFNPPR